MNDLNDDIIICSWGSTWSENSIDIYRKKLSIIKNDKSIIHSSIQDFQWSWQNMITCIKVREYQGKISYDVFYVLKLLLLKIFISDHKQICDTFFRSLKIIFFIYILCKQNSFQRNCTSYYFCNTMLDTSLVCRISFYFIFWKRRKFDSWIFKKMHQPNSMKFERKIIFAAKNTTLFVR